MNTNQAQTNSSAISYVPIGDSYTIGEGVKPGDRWPNLLQKHLAKEGIAIDLITNPCVTGWTTQDAIDKELPIFKAHRPGFSTLLIGVNDWVQKVPEEVFRINLVYLMDTMLAYMSAPRKIVVVTIPDFGVTPTGARYSGGRDISAGIAHFNGIIKEEAAKRNLPVADIFEISKAAQNRPELIAGDGLHPSPEEYKRWEAVIYPVVQGALGQ